MSERAASTPVPPFFSVVVPTCERPAQLAACLRALARADYPRERFEVIVVDDGGATPLACVLGQFRETFELKLFEQGNAGPAAARNFGAAQARGEFLAFTDDDCEPDAGWLRALALRLAKSPRGIVGGRTLNALPENLCAETSQRIIEVVYAHFNADPDDARFFASNNFAVSAARFREVGGFDDTFRTSEDREICARWRARGGKLTYAPEAVIRHAHPLTPRTLWRQHFGYGRGAQRFHRAAGGGARFKPDLIFYLKLFSSGAARARRAAQLPRAAKLTLLLVWSQLANAAGFLYEGFQSRGEDRGGTPRLRGK
ncbi:MAG: glycosyltransferase [Acidobacteria bacterium]|nr:glycosyltransferase [Acidobacteriota bacterium]